MSFIANKKVYFRSDSSFQIGYGHLMRSVALCQMLGEEYETIFVCARPDSFTKRIVSKFGKLIALEADNKTEEILELSEILSKDDILILDGYDFDFDYQNQMKSIGLRIVLIDDFVRSNYHVDLIINHGNQSLDKEYINITNAKVLTGLKHLIIRPFFLQCAKNKLVNIKEVKTVFICFGGADPFGFTKAIVEACLSSLRFEKIIIIIGPAFQNKDELDQLILNSEIPIQLENSIDEFRMVELILESDLCICPASTIALEVASLGRPLCIGTVIDNQKHIYEELTTKNCAIGFGEFQKTEWNLFKLAIRALDLEVLSNLVVNQRKYIDGYSSERISEAINELISQR